MIFPDSTALRTVPLGIILALLLAPTAAAQIDSSFSVSGEIRQRSELDARDFDAGTTPADFHLLRTRLNVSVEPVDRVDVRVQLQDSRRFGAGNPALGRGTLDPSAGALDLHQGYFKVKGLFDVPLSLKIGRQELIYGNQRLVGAVGWSNVGRTFDAGVLTYDGSDVSIDLFAARLVGTTAEDEGSQNLFGLYGTWEGLDGQTLDVFALLDNDTNDITTGPDGDSKNRLVRFTPGVALRGTVSRFSYELEAAYQTGKRAVATDVDRSTIQASLLSAYVSSSLNTTPDLTIGAGYTRLSGDDVPRDDDLGQFNTLFATNHKFYGFMDFFPATASQFGLQDTHLKTSVQLSEQVSLSADFHHFAQTESTPDRSLQTLGQELDLTATYRFAEPVRFTAGLSGFLPADAMERAVGNDDPAYWGYLMSTINF
ncbi:MAG: alginate export family protein [Salinibacter sp.]